MSNHEHHGMKSLTGTSPFCRMSQYHQHQNRREDRFGRLFTELAPAFTRPDILRTIGARNGPMDGKSIASRTATIPVGMVFFGQLDTSKNRLFSA